MIVVDSSSLVAIAEQEADWLDHLACLQTSDKTLIATVNYVETGMVLSSRGFFKTLSEFDAWLAGFRVEVDVAPPSDVALQAFLMFGRGRHRARLNLGDCFAYGLAKLHGVPLLFKGDDFSRTDIQPALYPT